MSTPSKRRREARAKIFNSDGTGRRGFFVHVQCPKRECGHVFKHALGTLDPAEGKCSHSWVRNPFRGVRGGIECTNCDLFISEEVLEASAYAPECARLVGIKRSE